MTRTMAAPPTSLRLSNQGVVASCEPGTGRLLTLTDRHGQVLVHRASFSYVFQGVTYCDVDTQSNSAGEQTLIRTVRLDVTPQRVRSVLRSPHLQITRELFLPATSLLARLRLRVRALVDLHRATRVTLPKFHFGASLADPLGDERDHYFDGAELENGLELPAWRVFFKQSSDDGLFIATPLREMMRHLQILPDGLEIMPHRAVLYATDMQARFPPLSLQGGQTLTHEFWLSPWSRELHPRLQSELNLLEPRRRRVKCSSIRPSPNSPEIPANSHQEHLIALPDITPGPVTTSWRCVPAPWSCTGRAWYVPSVSFPEPMELRPRVQGRHRILIDIGAGSPPLLRIDGEPIYRLLGEARNNFNRVLTGDSLESHVIDFGVHALRESSVLSLARNPERHANTLIGSLRLVPTTQPAREPCAGALPLHSFIDTPDINALNDCQQPTTEPYLHVIRQHACMGFTSLIWRIDGQVTEYPTHIGTRRFVYGKVHGVYSPLTKEGGRIQRKIDMLRLAVDAAHAVNLKVFGWMRFNAYFGNIESEFYRENPQFWETFETGSTGRKLCLAHPQVRAHKRAILLEAARYGLDGLNLGFLRHAPILHRAPILVEGFRREFGEDPPVIDHIEQMNCNESFPPGDERFTRWYAYRARFMTQFGRELKHDLREAGLGHLPVTIWVRPNHCLFDGIDLDTWLEEGLCDGVVADSMHSGRVGEPWVEPTSQWIAKVRKHVPLIRGLSAFLYPTTRTHLREFLKQYDGVSIYEGNAAVVDDRFRNLFESELDRLQVPTPG